MKIILLTQICMLIITTSCAQSVNRVGRFEEVYAWKQITYDVNGISVLRDRFADFGEEENEELSERFSDSDSKIVFADNGDWDHKPWNVATEPPPAANPIEEIGRFYIKYNNLPMGVERVGSRLFITVPRRRYGIPATINYIDLSDKRRSPALSPYPSMQESRAVISVYRTRADQCGRLWAVDTGTIEIPNNVTFLLRPAIVIYDLHTNKLLRRYELKSTDLPTQNSATGLASITIELPNGDCSDAYAYVVDLVSNALIVYSLRENTSWRQTHNFYSFMPTAGNMRIAGQSFQWNDGVFSVTLGRPGIDGCRPAYFHPMVSFQEFMISTCELRKRVANPMLYRYIGDRGENSQCTMHGLHEGTNVIFFADIGRNAVSCWNVDKPLTKDNIVILASDEDKMSYPADLHVTDDEVWVMANKLPRFGYSRLDTNEYNFFVYRAKVNDLIAGTACASYYG